MSRAPLIHRGSPGPEPRTGSRRRRWVALGAAVAGAAQLRTSLSSTPGSPRFHAWSLAAAATWIVGGLGSGPLHLGRTNDAAARRPVLTPVVLGIGAFAVFYGCALAARRIPVLNRAITRVLRHADQGNGPSVLITTLVSGAAEEVFFRGAVYAAAGPGHPVVVSTAVYTLVTTATRNPALVLAAAVMGALFGMQRRATGGIQAPVLTHLTWSTLMLRFLPPLFRGRPALHADR